MKKTEKHQSDQRYDTSISTGNIQEKYRKKTAFVKEYVVIDFETTGLSANEDEIIEIGAVRFKNGEVVEKYSQLIKPTNPISEFITNHTGITNDMTEDAPSINSVLSELIMFIGDSVIVAHNASFDMKFYLAAIANSDIDHYVNNQVSDTVALARKYYPHLKKS